MKLVRYLVAGVAMVFIAAVAAGGVVSAASGMLSGRGRLIDIGGRNLRLVCAGPEVLHAKAGRPLILLEAGAFGFAADWAVVQARLAARGIASCAYDRAGLGFSDPGARPRDGLAIQADLEKLIAAAGLYGPYIYVGHSMAGLRARMFAARHPDEVLGFVLVDAVSPEAMDSPRSRQFVRHFATLSDWAGLAASAGLFKPLARSFGEKIGLSGEAAAEKRWAFGRGAHNRWAADEVRNWPLSSQQAAATPSFDPELPLAVVMAGDPASDWGKAKAAPAKASRRGRVDAVAGAGHATLLGETYADAIVRGVQHVMDNPAPNHQVPSHQAPDIQAGNEMQTTKAAQSARP